jgi:hypothetical protein
VQYADEVAVVKNFRPMKAGNRLEEKTERTRFKINGAQAKVCLWCEGRKRSQSVSERAFSEGEGVKRKLKCWKDRMEGSQMGTRHSDHTDEE